MGHAVFDSTPRYVETSLIAGIVLAEPILAAVLARVVLSKKSGPATALGGVIVFFGILLLRARRLSLFP